MLISLSPFFRASPLLRYFVLLSPLNLPEKTKTQHPKLSPKIPKISQHHTRRDERRAGVAALQRARKEAGGGGSAGAQFNIDNSA